MQYYPDQIKQLLVTTVNTKGSEVKDLLKSVVVSGVWLTSHSLCDRARGFSYSTIKVMWESWEAQLIHQERGEGGVNAWLAEGAGVQVELVKNWRGGCTYTGRKSDKETKCLAAVLET